MVILIRHNYVKEISNINNGCVAFQMKSPILTRQNITDILNYYSY